MSIKMNTVCYQCHMNRSLETARSLGDEATATAFLRELMKLYAELPEEASSPTLSPKTAELLQKFYGLDPDRYKEEKRLSNAFVMERLDSVRQRIDASEDKLYAALQFAVLGNYIDFSALQGKVSFDALEEMLEKAKDIALDKAVYQELCRDLAQGKTLLYLTDNAGEICFDRLFGEQIHKEFPHLEITFCVRGGPAHNDATREDAVAVGIPFPIIDNGNNVGGTELSLLSKEAKTALETADVVIAKGQGNIETMLGCGYNVYYAFLVKCQRFVEEFQKPLLTPMLLRERKN
ncbi:MAG: DUF89 family protein [Oscillospiraceae bacterium]|nr:DUF89 family protein [Oscillospiraceae bacterium]